MTGAVLTCGPMPRRFTIKQRLGYALVAVVALLLLLEGAARVLEIWWPPRAVDYGLGFDPDSRLFATLESDPDQLITHPDKRANFLTARFSAKKPEGVVRIVAIGGSSVRLLEPDFQKLEAALGDRLGRAVDIINCGGDSYGSHRLVPIAVEMMGYDPDLVVLYTGHNEFEEIEQLDLAALNNLVLRKTLSRSALVRAIRDVVAGYRIESLRDDHNARIMGASRPAHARAWAHRFTAEEIAERMVAFEANLTTILRLCRERGVPIIMGTVPSDHYKPHLPAQDAQRFVRATQRYDNKQWAEGLVIAREVLATTTGRHQTSDVENGIIRRVAEAQQVPLADIEAAVVAAEPDGVPGRTLFMDHCHLNGDGMAIWRKTTQPFIEAALR